ncbi:MAG: hypothetical protein Q9178_008059 [Gyalolechia marmorata]
MRSEIDRAITTNEEQHAMTRQHAETHITSVMQSLRISQNRYWSVQAQDQQSQRRFDQFLESLWFSDMNLRTNDVSASYPGTFQWMFDTTTKKPWSSFTEWLKGNDHMYWVQGKAGSGKTTLMKFIANDPRTRDLLGQSSSHDKTLIATFYFWLSGSKLQRSLKGLLCSLSRQIMLENRVLFDSVCVEKTAPTKRSIHDWSDKELQHLLMRLIDFSTGPICIFVDGLDEFDHGEDVDNLLDLLETLASLGKVKICVSSRPENYIIKRMSKYSRIRLQDLTEDDIRICIRDSLHHARIRCSPTTVDNERIGEIVSVMTVKAEGVFLWVFYALSSLIRGMRNEDSFRELLDRIEQLPSGVYQLYSQMWYRNEDQQHYRDEAAIYFSYGNFYPLSVFQLLVAMDSSLQGDYIEKLKPHTATELERQCQRLFDRIHTVCAGLLEVVTEEDSSRSVEGSRVNSAVRDEDPMATDPITDDGSCPVILKFYCKSRIQFLHRTARDFILETKEGQVISGKSVDSLQTRFRNVVRAQLAIAIQKLDELRGSCIPYIFCAVGELQTDHETELLITTKRVIEHLSMPVSVGADILTNHVLEGWVHNPAMAFMSLVMASDGWDVSLTSQIAEVFQLFLPKIYTSSGECILFFHCEDGRRVYEAAFEASFGCVSRHSVIAQMTLKKLCIITMNKLKDLGAFGPQWSPPVLEKLGVTKIGLSFDTSNDIEGLPREAFRPSSEDSIYLGEALDDILLWDETSPSSLDSLTKVFEARRAEVHERSRLRSLRNWSSDNGWYVYKKYLVEHRLDPAEEVDESNWMEKGYFKKPNEDLGSPPSNLENMEEYDSTWSSEEESSSLMSTSSQQTQA